MITTTTREVRFGEILFDWAKAESDRISREVSPQLGAIAARAAAGETLSNRDVTLAVIGILYCRGQDIGALYLDTYFEHYPDLPGNPDLRTVAELAERDPKNCLRGPFDLAKMQGKPVL